MKQRRKGVMYKLFLVYLPVLMIVISVLGAIFSKAIIKRAELNYIDIIQSVEFFRVIGGGIFFPLIAILLLSITLKDNGFDFFIIKKRMYAVFVIFVCFVCFYSTWNYSVFKDKHIENKILGLERSRINYTDIEFIEINLHWKKGRGSKNETLDYTLISDEGKSIIASHYLDTTIDKDNLNVIFKIDDSIKLNNRNVKYKYVNINKKVYESVVSKIDEVTVKKLDKLLNQK